MTFLYGLVVVLHLVGMAALVGGWLTVIRAPRAVAPMVWGARAQLITGLLLVAMISMFPELDKDVDNLKIGVKLVIALIAVVLLEIRGRRSRGDYRSLVNAAGLMGLLNVFVAVLW